MLVVYIHPEQWNGGSDRFAAGLLRYFDKNNHRVIWLTTMIDNHWREEHFGSNVGTSSNLYMPTCDYHILKFVHFQKYGKLDFPYIRAIGSPRTWR